MCDTCGCGDTNLVPVDVHVSLLAKNDAVAGHLRAHFREAGVLAINLMGSPGSGKTALLEATSRAATGKRIQAVSGDLATTRDADRLQAAGIVSRAITTGTACHLDAQLVHDALHAMDWTESDWFFVENVGNLVCPAIYDLGQDANVVALSVTEGEDKPLKYPVMFERAQLVVITKIDLVPYLDFDLPALRANIARIAPKAEVIEVSARTGQGIDAWASWLRAREVRPRFVVGARPPFVGHAR